MSEEQLSNQEGTWATDEAPLYVGLARERGERIKALEQERDRLDAELLDACADLEEMSKTVTRLRSLNNALLDVIRNLAN